MLAGGPSFARWLRQRSPRGAEGNASPAAPTEYPPIGALHVISGRRPAMLLRERPQRFLVLVPRVHACETWERLLRAGRPHGHACVGRDALDLLRAGTPA